MFSILLFREKGNMLKTKEERWDIKFFKTPSNKKSIRKFSLASSKCCNLKCVIHHERDVPEEQHHTYVWREQAIIE